MELSKALRTGYYTRLNGAVMNGINPVPVYDAYAIPANVSYPYILLSSQTSSQLGAKGCKIYEASLLIDIVTGSPYVSGRDQAETIANQIELLVNPDNNENLNIEGNGYEILTTYRRSDSDQTAKNGTYYIYRKLMRYEHKISKL